MIVVSHIEQGPFCEAWPMQTSITLSYFNEHGFLTCEDTVPLTQELVDSLSDKWVCSEYVLKVIDKALITLP